ncbi:MAG: 4Fe-4S dicluster domain-containing protein [Clostridia bacterium]|nr:4Fe-4S dicluster domain-containing protein [Clostridia bacterium]
MKVTLSVLRRENGNTESYWQDFKFETKSETDTVASALRALNERENLTDINKNPARQIEWECSCLQKKCGACAMVICGRPRLACDTRISEFKDRVITVEPLKKFPVICDLIVDRRILFENLKTLRLWLNQDAQLGDRYRELAYEASECIQCGCCLEICPNFYINGRFFGMASVPITTRLLTEMTSSEAREIAKLYRQHTFEGCGKSLACKDVCPKKIDTEKLMVNANAFAIWKRKRG